MNLSDIEAYLDQLTNTFRYMARSGCGGFDVSPDKLAIINSWGKRPPVVRKETLDDIQKDLSGCRRCGLHVTRKHIVFGDGTPKARLVFVGEGPGADEDIQGKPFVGAAGQLLTRIIEAMGLKREQVYICNVVKCRPPGNRNPLPDEIQECSSFLERQLLAIKPEYICALGKFSAQFLLKTEAPISTLRGRIFDYHGIKVIPTYHPAYLLRNPEKKRDVWEDVKKIMNGLGLTLKDRKQ